MSLQASAVTTWSMYCNNSMLIHTPHILLAAASGIGRLQPHTDCLSSHLHSMLFIKHCRGLCCLKPPRFLNAALSGRCTGDSLCAHTGDAALIMPRIMWCGAMVCRELLATAKEATGGSGPDDDLQQQFNDLTEDVDELKQQVIQLRAEAEGISCANPRVVSHSLHQDGFALLPRVSGLALVTTCYGITAAVVVLLVERCYCQACHAHLRKSCHKQSDYASSLYLPLGNLHRNGLKMLGTLLVLHAWLVSLSHCHCSSSCKSSKSGRRRLSTWRKS